MGMSVFETTKNTSRIDDMRSVMKMDMTWSMFVDDKGKVVKCHCWYEERKKERKKEKKKTN